MRKTRLVSAVAVVVFGVSACGGTVQSMQVETSAPTASETPVVYTSNPMDTVAPPKEEPSSSSDEPYWLDTGSGVVQEISLDLEQSGGYKASAHVEWYAPREIEAIGVPFLKNFPAPENIAARAIRVHATFTPENVNGFDWPSEAPFGLVFGEFGSAGASPDGGQGYSYLDESGTYVPPMETETGVMYYSADGDEMKIAADIIFFAEKNPENPDGDWIKSNFGIRPMTLAIPYCVDDQSAKGFDIKDAGITLHSEYAIKTDGCWVMPEKIYSDPLTVLPKNE